MLNQITLKDAIGPNTVVHYHSAQQCRMIKESETEKVFRMERYIAMSVPLTHYLHME